jgi:hypothetical protein
MTRDRDLLERCSRFGLRGGVGRWKLSMRDESDPEYLPVGPTTKL